MTRFLSRDVLLAPAKAAAYLNVERNVIKALLDARKIPYEVLTTGARPVRRVRKSVLDRLLAERRAS